MAGRRKKHIFARIVGILFLLVLLTGTVLAAVVYKKYGKKVLAYRDDAKRIMRNASREDFIRTETGFIYAGDGSLLKTLRAERDVYYIPYEAIPKPVVTAMVVTEDKKFFSHAGVDWLANLRAAYSLVKHNGTIYQGGSTITQQLARNIYLTNKKTYERKITEIFLAEELEKRYSKEEIMEFYLNNIYFANGFYGIQAAAHGYFSKGVAELTLSEQAFLCAIPNNPTLYDPYLRFEDTLKRRNSVLEQMKNDGEITEKEYREAIAQKIVMHSQEKPYNDYLETFAVFCSVRALMERDGFAFRFQFSSEAEKDRYLDEYSDSYAYWQQELYRGGYRVYTSLDPKKQEMLLTSVQNQLAEFDEKTEDGRYELQGAATCVDNDTGYVVAIVGGRGETTGGYSLNRAYQSFRQPGSSIKPLIVYTPWLERGYFPDTIVLDKKFAGGPNNANFVYSGEITLRRAVEVSKNTVAWKLFEELTPEVGLSYIQNMRFRNIVPSDYVPAASLGGLTYGVCTLEMAGAYSALANDGIYRTPTCVVKITDSSGKELVGEFRERKKIYDKNAARMMTNILQGVMTTGTGTKLIMKNAVCAGKTGTTNDIKDGWFVGYTAYYTTAVWVGYDYPKPLDNLAGNTYPGYIWQNFMEQLHEDLPRKDFPLYEDNRPIPIVDDSELDAMTLLARIKAKEDLERAEEARLAEEARPAEEAKREQTENRAGENGQSGSRTKERENPGDITGEGNETADISGNEANEPDNGTQSDGDTGELPVNPIGPVGTPQKPVGEPQPPYYGEPQSPYYGEPQSPYYGEPQSPYYGEPQSPYYGEPQSPYYGESQSPYYGEPQSPYYGEPQ